MRGILVVATCASISAVACAQILGVDGDGYHASGSTGGAGSAGANDSGRADGAGGSGGADASAGSAGTGGSGGAGGNAGASGSGGNAGSGGAAGSAGSAGTSGGLGATGGTAGSSGNGGTGGTAGSAGGNGGGAGSSGGTGATAGASGNAGSSGSAGKGGNAGASTGGQGGSGGNAGAGGTSGTSGSGGAAGSSGAGGSGGSGGTSCDAGVGPPSCNCLALTCGPTGNGDCCASSVVQGGMFNRSNDPNYPATISTFRLDDYEITVGRFRQFVAVYTQDMIASGAGKNPNNLDDPGWDVSWNASLPANATELTSAVACDGTYQTWTPSAAGNENRPMNCLSWYEAEAFCTWDGGRLPTEAEWNYAAAGGNRQRMYPWGTLMPTGANFAAYGCYYNGTGPGTCTGTTNIAPVGAILDSKGDYGQYDLAGNVWEWVQDWWETTYPTMSCNDCAHLTGHDSRVNRGGSFMGDLSYLATSYRQSTTLPYRYYVLGARCARLP